MNPSQPPPWNTKVSSLVQPLPAATAVAEPFTIIPLAVPIPESERRRWSVKEEDAEAEWEGANRKEF
ncbi:hypothetical protein E3N88_30555 [Mikania micrantha]|uniref:Uncharacterized protein n=1 Tax=Mikania micrantha TaxID=192012 RepID=A0A5N6MLY6_9ASTR|nr:hypothetical protein E3N88_30555 [Mikania micrantha]